MRSLVGIIFIFSAYAQDSGAACSSVNGSGVEGIISDALGDKNPDTRVQAVQSMGLIGVHVPYISTLDGMLDDKDVEVRVATVTSLVDLKNPKTVPALREGFGRSNTGGKFPPPAKALWTLRGPGRRRCAAFRAERRAESASSKFLDKKKRETLPHVPHADAADVLRDQDGRRVRAGTGIGDGRFLVAGNPFGPSNVWARSDAALLLATDKDPRVLGGAARRACRIKKRSVRAAACCTPSRCAMIEKLESNLVPLFDDKKAAAKLRAAARISAAGVFRVAPVKASGPRRQRRDEDGRKKVVARF